MNTAFVTPISRKAKNRLANLMDNNDQCIVEQNTGRNLFLTSMNRKYHFWVSLDNDAHWIVDF